jgi:hypothetical protein
MTKSRALPWLAAALVCAAAVPFPAHSGDNGPAAPQMRTLDATKARQDADRQRLLAKLRSDAPKAREAPAKASPLDLPIFRRHDRP